MSKDFDFNQLSNDMSPGYMTEQNGVSLVFAVNSLTTAVNSHTTALDALKDALTVINDRRNTLEVVLIKRMLEMENRLTALEEDNE